MFLRNLVIALGLSGVFACSPQKNWVEEYQCANGQSAVLSSHEPQNYDEAGPFLSWQGEKRKISAFKGRDGVMRYRKSGSNELLADVIKTPETHTKFLRLYENGAPQGQCGLVGYVVS